MKLADCPFEWTAYTQLASTALAVVVRRADGWCVYVAGVPGMRHAEEWQEVRDHGDKAKEPLARAILASYFYPPIDPGGLEYAR